MKRIYLILVIIFLTTVSIVAQTGKNEWAKAWKKFQTAIAKNGKQAVAALVQFPFEASIIGEDSNFRIESEAEFLKKYDSIFKPVRRKKILHGKIAFTAQDDEFSFEMFENSAYHVFIFRKVGGVYKLVGTMGAG